MPTLSSLEASQVVLMAICGVTSDAKVGIMTTFGFQFCSPVMLYSINDMMVSCHGNTFHITKPLWWISPQNSSNAELRCFLLFLACVSYWTNIKVASDLRHHCTDVMALEWIFYLMSVYTKSLFNSLWPSGALWRQRSGSTLAQVMACCLTAPSHCLNQCWLIISKV